MATQTLTVDPRSPVDEVARLTAQVAALTAQVVSLAGMLVQANTTAAFCPGEEDLVAAYLVDGRRRGLTERTLGAYEERLRLFEREHDKPVWTVTQTDIERWLDAHCHKAQTRSTYRSTVAEFFGYLARSHGFTAPNPAKGTARPRVKKGRPRPIPAKDLETAFVNANSRMRAIIALGAFAGLRRMEIAGLSVGDIDIAGRMVHVRSGKGDKERFVPMHDDLAVALDAYVLHHPLPAEGALFRNRYGHRYSPDLLGQILGDHLHKHAGTATPHRLRHTFATSALAGGCALETVRDLLGHDSVATTEIYAKVPERNMRAAVDVMTNAKHVPEDIRAGRLAS